jgi:regulator of replication initiation timing
MNALHSLEQKIKEEKEKNKLLLKSLERHIEKESELRMENLKLKGLDKPCPVPIREKALG